MREKVVVRPSADSDTNNFPDSRLGGQVIRCELAGRWISIEYELFACESVPVLLLEPGLGCWRIC